MTFESIHNLIMSLMNQESSITYALEAIKEALPELEKISEDDFWGNVMNEHEATKYLAKQRAKITDQIYTLKKARFIMQNTKA